MDTGGTQGGYRGDTGHRGDIGIHRGDKGGTQGGHAAQVEGASGSAHTLCQPSCGSSVGSQHSRPHFPPLFPPVPPPCTPPRCTAAWSSSLSNRSPRQPKDGRGMRDGGTASPGSGAGARRPLSCEYGGKGGGGGIGPWYNGVHGGDLCSWGRGECVGP